MRSNHYIEEEMVDNFFPTRLCVSSFEDMFAPEEHYLRVLLFVTRTGDFPIRLD